MKVDDLKMFVILVLIPRFVNFLSGVVSNFLSQQLTNIYCILFPMGIAVHSSPSYNDVDDYCILNVYYVPIILLGFDTLYFLCSILASQILLV